MTNDILTERQATIIRSAMADVQFAQRRLNELAMAAGLEDGDKLAADGRTILRATKPAAAVPTNGAEQPVPVPPPPS